MKKRQNFHPLMLSLSVSSLLLLSETYAGSFSLYTESSGVAVGNFAAGSAAEARDASTGWYNPAGLARIHEQQVVVSGVAVLPRTEITGTSEFITGGLPSYMQGFQGLEGASDGFIPSAHYALPLSPNTSVGLSLVSPFGLKTDWDPEGPVRYAATTSELVTLNVSPELGSQLTEHTAFGFGLDVQYARVKFNRVLGSPTLMEIFELPPNSLDSTSTNQGDSVGFGFHVGLLERFNGDHTRLGLNYQSEVIQQFEGESRLRGRLASPGLILLDPEDVLAANPNAEFISHGLSSNPLTFPRIITVSAYQEVNDQLAVLGSAVFTGWSVFKTIELNQIAAYSALPPEQTVLSSTSPENYRDTWRFALGTNYFFTQQWMLRLGMGYDETPTNPMYRSIRIPDSNRWAAAIGAHFQWKPNVGVDLGYTHLFVDETNINRTDITGPTSSYLINAKVNSHVNILGLQANWTIV